MSDSKPINTGGFAFPVEGRNDGMTLRDYFAVKAMGAYLSTQGVMAQPNRISVAAYDIADAMIAERERAT